MASHDFFFAFEVSSQSAPVALVDDLAEQVLRHVGCSLGDAPELTVALAKAVAGGSPGRRRCDLQFRAHNGSLEILVSSNGGRLCQTSVIIP